MYSCTTSGTIFSADVWISGGQVGSFSIQTWCVPLEAFAYKNITKSKGYNYNIKRKRFF